MKPIRSMLKGSNTFGPDEPAEETAENLERALGSFREIIAQLKESIHIIMKSAN